MTHTDYFPTCGATSVCRIEYLTRELVAEQVACTLPAGHDGPHRARMSTGSTWIFGPERKTEHAANI